MRLQPPPLRAVSINDHFWSERQRINREATLPAEYHQCEITGRVQALTLPPMPEQHIFWHSDIAKWIEAAAYSLSTHPDPSTEALLGTVIALLAAAQQPDGYSNTYFTAVAPEGRWTNLRENHELYSFGV